MLSTDTVIPMVRTLDFKSVEANSINKFWMHLVTDGMGQPVCVPIIVARGKSEGPVLGVSAAVHGNEINGISVIQSLFQDLNTEEMAGTVVGVPVVNVPSLLRKQRRFLDGVDLNHIMPGNDKGNVSQIYAYRIFHQIVSQFDYLVDLHTASFGRVNSYYIRADMEDETTAKMALLQNADIIVHNPPSDGTLRGAADEIGIPAITLEVGDPNRFQKGMIRSSLTGIHNLLSYLNITNDEIEEPEDKAVQCLDSKWIYTQTGGILRVLPGVAETVGEGEVIARLETIFGDVIKKYVAPCDGIVIGKSVNPICQSGGRILHLGLTK